MLHMRKGRRIGVSRVRETREHGRGSQSGSRRPRIREVLLPQDDRFPRRPHRRDCSARMNIQLGRFPSQRQLFKPKLFPPSYTGPWGSLVSFVLGVHVTPVQIWAGPLSASLITTFAQSSQQPHAQGALRVFKRDSDAPRPGRWVLQLVPRPISSITISSLADRCIWLRGRTSRMSGTSPPVPRSRFTAFRTGTPPS